MIWLLIKWSMDKGNYIHSQLQSLRSWVKFHRWQARKRCWQCPPVPLRPLSQPLEACHPILTPCRNTIISTIRSSIHKMPNQRPKSRSQAAKSFRSSISERSRIFANRSWNRLKATMKEWRVYRSHKLSAKRTKETIRRSPAIQRASRVKRTPSRKEKVLNVAWRTDPWASSWRPTTMITLVSVVCRRRATTRRPSPSPWACLRRQKWWATPRVSWARPHRI